MNILHLVHCYPPAIGGTEFFVKELSERLTTTYNDKVSVFTTTAYNCEAFTDSNLTVMQSGIQYINGVEVRRYSFNPYISRFFNNIDRFCFENSAPFKYFFRYLSKGPFAMRMFLDLLLKNNYDLIMATTFPLLHMLYALLGGKFNDVPVILRGCFHIKDKLSFDNPLFYKMINSCRKYIANSNAEKEYLISKGVRDSKIKIIECGVDLKIFREHNIDKFKANNNIPATDKIILFVGQKIIYKGINNLIKSMEFVWKDNPDTTLLLCGGAYSGYMTELKKIINDLPENYQKKIVNIDNFFDEEKSDIYNSADVFVLPSEFESFGMTFLEAWASGKPVIGCRTKAVRSIIKENDNGLLVEYNNIKELSEKINILLNDKNLRNKLGCNGRSLVEKKYSYNNIVQAFQELYTKIVYS